MPAIPIDGAVGGGQILRSALALSMCTGQPFVIDGIRAQRSRPGLLRQHLTAVRAAASVCNAEVDGDELGSLRLAFRPRAVRAGAYTFAVGSAGSACLVLQTVLPALVRAAEPSQLSLSGGTHNPSAPPYDFLDRVFFPVLERMGVGLTRRLTRPGFFPAGGGSFEVSVQPVQRLTPIELHTRGALRSVTAKACLANLPGSIGLRELAVATNMLNLTAEQTMLRSEDADGSGNVFMLLAEHEHATELITGFGMPRLRAERIAEDACLELQTYLQADVPVGAHLADQLLLPFALAGAGSFRTLPLTDHARTNIGVIESFLPQRFVVDGDRVSVT